MGPSSGKKNRNAKTGKTQVKFSHQKQPKLDQFLVELLLKVKSGQGRFRPRWTDVRIAHAFKNKKENLTFSITSAISLR